MAAARVMGAMLIVGDQNMVRKRSLEERVEILMSEEQTGQQSDWKEDIFKKIKSRCKDNPDLLRVLVFLRTGDKVDPYMQRLRTYFLDNEAFDAYLFRLARALDGEDIEADVPNWLLRRFSLETMKRLSKKLKRLRTTCEDKILACACKFIECCSEVYSKIKNYFLGKIRGMDALDALFFSLCGVLVGAIAGGIASGVMGGLIGGPPGACVGAIWGGISGGSLGASTSAAIVYTALKKRFFGRPLQEAVDISFDLIGVEPSSSSEDLQEHFIGALERSNSETDMMINIVAQGFIEASLYSS